MKAQRWGRLFGTLVIVALLALATALSSLSGVASGRPDSSRSNAEDGRRAARLVLSELGFETRVWRRRPAELPRERTLFVLAGVPSSAGEPGDPLLAARSSGPHDPQYYRRFVDEGGVLALPATKAALTWLSAELKVAAFAGMTLGAPEDLDQMEGGNRATRQVRTTAARIPGRSESFECQLHKYAIDPGDATHEPLLTAPQGRPLLALSVPVGRGSIALWPPGLFLRNDSLGEQDHGLLWVRLIEQIAPERRVWFDEYALGDQERDSAFSLSFSPALSILTWHVLALALVALWRGAWPRPFPRSSESRAPMEPLARVRAQAAWFVRGRRRELLARELRRAAWNDLVRRHGSRAATFETGRTPREAEVRALALRAGADADAWVGLLVDRQPRTGVDLDQLGRDLAELNGVDRSTDLPGSYGVSLERS